MYCEFQRWINRVALFLLIRRLPLCVTSSESAYHVKFDSPPRICIDKGLALFAKQIIQHLWLQHVTILDYPQPLEQYIYTTWRATKSRQLQDRSQLQWTSVKDDMLDFRRHSNVRGAQGQTSSFKEDTVDTNQV